MTRRVQEVTKDELIEQFNAVVAETEQLLKSVATAGGQKADALRSGVEQNLADAKDRLLELRHAAAETTEVAVKKTDKYVHAHPWQAIGVAAGLTAFLGLTMGLLLNRR